MDVANFSLCNLQYGNLSFVPCTLTSLVSTHNAGIRTQGRGRYDGRPAKVVGQNGYQTSVNSRAPGATAEQRATLPAPSPDKVRRQCLVAEWNGDVDCVHMYIVCVQYSKMVTGQLCNIILM